MKNSLRFLSLPLAALSTVPAHALTVELLSPPDGGHYYVGTQVPFFVDAHDDDGLVTQVDYFLNGQIVGTTASAPYFAQITLPGEGAYFLEARATDNDGNTATTDRV